MVIHNIARLEPMMEIKYPSEIVPQIAPKQLIEPIQEISSFVNNPDSKGVFSFDDKVGNAIARWPIAVPCDNMIKFTKWKMISEIIVRMRKKKPAQKYP